MLKKFLSATIIGLLFILPCAAQNNPPIAPVEKKQINLKLTKTEFLKTSQVDFGKESYNYPSKNRRLSKGSKIAVWTGVIVGAAVLTGLIIWQVNKPDIRFNPNINNLNLNSP